jgi:hypothetical protein
LQLQYFNTKDYARTSNGESTKIGDIELQLDEEVISRVINLPLKRECWSKTKRVKDISWLEILVSPE